MCVGEHPAPLAHDVDTLFAAVGTMRGAAHLLPALLQNVKVPHICGGQRQVGVHSTNEVVPALKRLGAREGITAV